MSFTLKSRDSKTKARRGELKTAHGTLQTPFFMPVATSGVLKSLSREDLLEMEAQIMLSNTYHLYLRPGVEVLEHLGGLHKFANWHKPILTDSGGYQVFSLTKLRKIKNDGVEFRSHIDGSKHFFTPEKVVEIQRVIGSDIMMPLDVCAPYPCSKKEAEQSVAFTTEWAKRSMEAFCKTKGRHEQLHFGIVQGSVYQDLRERSAREIVAVDFDGFAVGGVSVGEPVKEMFEGLAWSMPFLPETKARYFMGIGLPDQMVKAVGEGIDMFDTCIPTRYGRHGSAFTRTGQIIMRNAEFARDESPIDPACHCFVCKNYTKSYIRHLLNVKELTGLRFVSFHNVHFYLNLMREIRAAIEAERYAEYQREFLTQYGSQLLTTVV